MTKKYLAGMLALGLAVVCAVAMALAAPSKQKPAETSLTMAVTPSVSTTPIIDPATEEARKAHFESINAQVRADMEIKALGRYVADSIKQWPKKGHVVADLDEVGLDIATVVLQPNERRAFSADTTGGETAILLASLAHNEGHFATYVDDGKCNDKKWRESPEGKKVMKGGGDCDGGHAYSLWQIHPETGVLLIEPDKDNNFREWDWARRLVKVHYPGEPVPQAVEDEHTDDKALRGPDLVGSSDHRQNAAHVALHMARMALHNGTLCGYTGEYKPNCPKADWRLKFARSWWKEHPYTVPDEVKNWSPEKQASNR